MFPLRHLWRLWWGTCLCWDYATGTTRFIKVKRFQLRHKMWAIFSTKRVSSCVIYKKGKTDESQALKGIISDSWHVCSHFRNTDGWVFWWNSHIIILNTSTAGKSVFCLSCRLQRNSAFFVLKHQNKTLFLPQDHNRHTDSI